MKLISEILNELRNLQTKQEKIQHLRQNKSAPLIFLMKCAFTTKFDKVTYIPKYEVDDSPAGYSYTSLYKTWKNIPYFFEKKEGAELEKQKKKLLILLESLHWTESALVENILTKNLEALPIDLQTMKEAFPKEFLNYV
jgi:hypothetical protein